MIEVNLTDLDNQSREYINMLTDNKGQEFRKEMIKFLKENNWPDSLEYGLIMEFINDFFIAFQPERLSEWDHINKNEDMISDSLNS